MRLGSHRGSASVQQPFTEALLCAGIGLGMTLGIKIMGLPPLVSLPSTSSS